MKYIRTAVWAIVGIFVFIPVQAFKIEDSHFTDADVLACYSGSIDHEQLQQLLEPLQQQCRRWAEHPTVKVYQQSRATYTREEADVLFIATDRVDGLRRVMGQELRDIRRKDKERLSELRIRCKTSCLEKNIDAAKSRAGQIVRGMMVDLQAITDQMLYSLREAVGDEQVPGAVERLPVDLINLPYEEIPENSATALYAQILKNAGSRRIINPITLAEPHDLSIRAFRENWTGSRDCSIRGVSYRGAKLSGLVQEYISYQSNYAISVVKPWLTEIDGIVEHLGILTLGIDQLFDEWITMGAYNHAVEVRKRFRDELHRHFHEAVGELLVQMKIVDQDHWPNLPDKFGAEWLKPYLDDLRSHVDIWTAWWDSQEDYTLEDWANTVHDKLGLNITADCREAFELFDEQLAKALEEEARDYQAYIDAYIDATERKLDSIYLRLEELVNVVLDVVQYNLLTYNPFSTAWVIND